MTSIGYDYHCYKCEEYFILLVPVHAHPPRQAWCPDCLDKSRETLQKAHMELKRISPDIKRSRD